MTEQERHPFPSNVPRLRADRFRVRFKARLKPYADG